MRLADRVAVITGRAAGFGFAYARRFLILSDTVQATLDISGFQMAAVTQGRSPRRDAFAGGVEGAVVALASEDSALTSGQTLVVDGGSVFSTL